MDSPLDASALLSPYPRSRASAARALPLIVLVYLALLMQLSCLARFIIFRTCYDRKGGACSEDEEKDSDVSAAASDRFASLCFTFYVLAVFSTVALSVASDFVGRRPVLLLSLGMLSVASFGTMWVALRPALPLELLYVFYCAAGLGGSFCCFNAVIFAYAADACAGRPEARARAFSRLEACIFLGGVVAPLVGGRLQQHVSQAAPFVCSSALFVSALLYILIALPESAPATARPLGKLREGFSLATLARSQWVVLSWGSRCGRAGRAGSEPLLSDGRQPAAATASTSSSPPAIPPAINDEGPRLPTDGASGAPSGSAAATATHPIACSAGAAGADEAMIGRGSPVWLWLLVFAALFGSSYASNAQLPLLTHLANSSVALDPADLGLLVSTGYAAKALVRSERCIGARARHGSPIGSVHASAHHGVRSAWLSHRLCLASQSHSPTRPLTPLPITPSLSPSLSLISLSLPLSLTPSLISLSPSLLHLSRSPPSPSLTTGLRPLLIPRCCFCSCRRRWRWEAPQRAA